jgi:DNA-binding NarL/FixJ family response regulator
MDRQVSPGSQTERARLVIADDHDLVRNGMQRMLAGEPDLEVVGEATNGREAVTLCRRVRPDLVLMDVRMPQMDGLEATRKIKEEQPTISVLVVTTHENPDYLLKALKAGAAGYILKDAPKRQLINAIRRVLNAESPLNQELAAQLIRSFAEERPIEQEEASPKPERSRTAPLETLTPRELEVLGLLAQGQSNPEIARNLVVSRGTVKVHVQHIISKLGVSDRTQAVVRALEMGLVSPASSGQQIPRSGPSA